MKSRSVKQITLESLDSLKCLILDINHLRSNLQTDFFYQISNIQELYVDLDSLNVSFSYFRLEKKLVFSLKSNKDIDFGPIYTIKNRIEKLQINESDIDNTQLFNICHTFTNLIELDIFKSKIAKIEKKMFDGLANLRSLKFFNNRNYHLMIDFDAFSNLKQLVDLDLSNNSFEPFDKRIFSELVNLETLDLGVIGLKSLDENIFSNLKNLRELYLRSNKFDAFDHRIFSGLENLYELHLPDYKSTHFDSRILDYLPRLKKIVLTRMSISDNEFEILTQFKTSGIDFEFYK